MPAPTSPLRLNVFRHLLPFMPAPKSPISVSARSLLTGPPEFGMPDLTEHRIVIRSFPKNSAERDCYRYLLGEMQAMPNRAPRTRAEFKTICRRQFRVTVESFDYCWREAIKVAAARWDQAGRRPRKKNSR